MEKDSALVASVITLCNKFKDSELIRIRGHIDTLLSVSHADETKVDLQEVLDSAESKFFDCNPRLDKSLAVCILFRPIHEMQYHSFKGKIVVYVDYEGNTYLISGDGVVSNPEKYITEVFHTIFSKKNPGGD